MLPLLPEPIFFMTFSSVSLYAAGPARMTAGQSALAPGSPDRRRRLVDQRLEVALGPARRKTVPTASKVPAGPEQEAPLGRNAETERPGRPFEELAQPPIVARVEVGLDDRARQQAEARRSVRPPATLRTSTPQACAAAAIATTTPPPASFAASASSAGEPASASIRWSATPPPR